MDGEAENLIARTRFDPDSMLQRVPDLEVRLDSSNVATVMTGANSIRCGPHGLAVLDVFTRPISLRNALERLRPRITGMQDWATTCNAILHLAHQGVLRDPERMGHVLERTDDSGSGAAWIHIKMLNDRRRVRSYLQGMREVVRAGDVVLDVGTGTGILAIAAAMAGAKHV